MGELRDLFMAMLAGVAIVSGIVIFMGGGAVYAPTNPSNYTSMSNTMAAINRTTYAVQGSLNQTTQTQVTTQDIFALGSLNALKLLLDTPSIVVNAIAELTYTPYGSLTWLGGILILAVSVITVFAFLRGVLKIDL